MARHEFGIMQNAPEPRKRYDEYEPQKYNCMSVDDDYIEKIVANLSNIDFNAYRVESASQKSAQCHKSVILSVSGVEDCARRRVQASNRPKGRLLASRNLRTYGT